ncbi:hypothetical protein A8A54_19380 [Brucella pseudogrignonensis]|uniref:hypothetical protein n=1 Tax=Brucella pseudogrignonensis TaxID=419475 RepID=UPI0007DA6AEA|nr:hypothetical protein [Brucella pseudogrignonensis]ANG98765.1 hypothetical protein A8A54_19380 [Brucella pseudogrignonensis]
MTKDGRPSPLHDTRLFTGNGGYSYLDHDEAWAFARRLTWWLNGEGFCIGHTPALYVYYTSDLPISTVEAAAPKYTPDDWWFRQVKVGVPAGFPGESALKYAADGLIAVLKSLKPEDAAMIDKAAEIVRAKGSDCRFLLKVKESAKQVVEISTTIGPFRDHSLLYVAVTDKATGTYREAPPAKIKSYDDGVYLAGKVKIARRGVEVTPRTSYMARLTVETHPNAATWSIDEFAEAERSLISGLLKFR